VNSFYEIGRPRSAAPKEGGRQRGGGKPRVKKQTGDDTRLAKKRKMKKSCVEYDYALERLWERHGCVNKI